MSVESEKLEAKLKSAETLEEKLAIKDQIMELENPEFYDRPEACQADGEGCCLMCSG